MCLDIHLALSFPKFLLVLFFFSAWVKLWCLLNFLLKSETIKLTKLNKQSSIRFFSLETKKKNYFPPPLNRKSRLWKSACSYNRQDRSKLFEVVPLVSCNKDVQGHKSAWCFAGVENESELILARAGIFYMSAKDINALTICPFHRSELGEGARIPSEFQMIAGMSALISLEIESCIWPLWLYSPNNA